MELPAALRTAVDTMLADTPLTVLREASRRLTDRYRSETLDGRMHLADETAARAYLAARMPATYAAVRRSMERVAERDPDFLPATILDIGAGPGTAMWAAYDCWGGTIRATAIEQSPAIRTLGANLAAHLPIDISWKQDDVSTAGLASQEQADLVIASYVLDEIVPTARSQLADKLWALTGQTLLIVEPGTPAGWQRILAVRDSVMRAGAQVLAPCPHAAPCPLAAPDWCHFAQRVARSRVHRLVKDGDVPWEDEKFIYLAATRRDVRSPSPRILAPPRSSSGRIDLKLCLPDGTCSTGTVTKRTGAAYKLARRANWGDTLSHPGE